MKSEQLEGAKKLFFILLCIDIAASVIVGFNAFSSISILRGIQSGTLSVDQEMVSKFDFMDNFSKIVFLTTVGVGIGLVKWLNACYRFAKEAIGTTGFKNEGWTWAGWIFPIFNFFKPYQVINEIYKAGSSGYATPDGWKRESGSSALLTWWIFWVVTHFITWIITKNFIIGISRDEISISQAVKLTETQAWFCIMSLVVAGLWFWVASVITQRMLSRGPISLKTQAKEYQLAPTCLDNEISSTTPHDQINNTRGEQQNATIDIDEETISRHEKVTPEMQESDDWAFEKVADELESNDKDKVLWTRAFAESGGNENKAKALYIQRRVVVLVESKRKRLSEEHAAKAEEIRLAAEQAKLIRNQEFRARQEAEALEKEKQAQVEATENARRAAARALKNKEQVEARLAELDRIATTMVQPKKGISAGSKFIVVLGIAAVILVVLLGRDEPDKPLATLSSAEYKQMTISDLQARAATDSVAAFQLAIHYWQGTGGVGKNMAESLRWGEKAAAAGHARSQALVGWYYTAGLGGPVDKQKGLIWLEKAAAQNDAVGLANLGWRYQIGDGVALDYQKAFEYAKRAADLGNRVGQNNLAELYEKGNGVTKDYSIALQLFEPLAVEAHTVDSVLGMIRIYADQRDKYYYPVLAYAWLQIALEKFDNNEEVQEHMNELLALKQILEGRLSVAQIEEGKLKAGGWEKGVYLRP